MINRFVLINGYSVIERAVALHNPVNSVGGPLCAKWYSLTLVDYYKRSKDIDPLLDASSNSNRLCTYVP